MIRTLIVVLAFCMLVMPAPLKLAAQSVEDGRAQIDRLHEQAQSLVKSDWTAAISAEDSAINLAKTSGNPEWIARAFGNAGDLYRHNNHLRTACLYYDSAVNADPTSQTAGDFYLQAGIALQRLIRYDTAIETLDKGIKLVSGTSESSSVEAALYNARGNVYREQNKYQEALRDYITATRLFESTNDLKGLTQPLSNIGNLHNLMNETDKALEYAQRSLEVAQQAGVPASVAYSYRLLGRIYRKQGKAAEALEAYAGANTIFDSLNARLEMAETFISIGNILFDQKRFSDAWTNYQGALTTVKALPDTLLMAYAYSAIGQTAMSLERWKDAQAYLDTTLVIAGLKGFGPLRMDALQALSEMYEKLGNDKLALHYYRNFISLRDSVTTIQNRKDALALEAQYQSEKKDDAIRILNAENEVKSSQQQMLIVVAGFMLILAVVLYNRYQVKTKANKKLLELDAVKSQFFTNISHELRTPLTLIMAPLERYLKDEADSDKRRQMDTMLRNAKQLHMLTEQMLDLAKLESGTMPLHLSINEAAGFVRLIAGAFETLAEQRGIDFKCIVASSVHHVCFDRDKLEKILNNLLSNAFKFTHEGGRIELRASQPDGDFQLEIVDTGRGISQDKIAHVFERFYQAHSEQSHVAGAGVGLALVKELAEVHHGSVSATSVDGEGSCFVVSVPADPEYYGRRGFVIEQADSAAINITNAYIEDRISLPSDGSEPQPLVLVAEDHPEMGAFIGDLLRPGYRVEVVSNGRLALERARQTVPDIVISDWMMPEMDGRTFCAEMRQNDATSHIPVLMLTARADLASKLEGFVTGVDDYLTKPFNGEELVARVDNLIAQRARLRRAFSRNVVLKPSNIPVTSRDETFLTRLMACIEQRHSDPKFGIDELANEMAMSRMQLHRKLKAITDQSPGELLRTFRLEKARGLLMSGRTVSEVCFEVGFNNVPHFSKAFREFTGETPTAFIKHQSEANQQTQVQ